MKKSELKQGMVVELRDGVRYLVRDREGEIVLSNHDGWLYLEEYSENLTDKTYSELDVMKVYTTKAYVLDRIFEGGYLTEIWSRKRSIDWNKVPKGTKLLGEAYILQNSNWVRRDEGCYFAGGISSNGEQIITSLLKEDDPFTGLEMDDFSVAKYRPIKEVKIHPEVKIKEEWYKWEE